MEPPEVAETLFTCHRIHAGVSIMTFEHFKGVVTTADPQAKDILRAYQQLRSNPTRWLSDLRQEKLSKEIIALILELAPI